MQIQVKLPKFTGKPLIEIPETIPVVNFLTGDFGKAVLEEYQARVKADYENARALNVLSYYKGNDVVIGSNPFAVVLINKIVQPEGIRVATPADLERVIATNALPLRGQYEDSALVLRSEDNPNEYLAKDLNAQVKAKRGKVNLPVMIPLAGLELRTDGNSPYGLAFNLGESAEVIYAPILNRDGRFNSSDIDLKTGIPKELRTEGERGNYSIKSGLSNSIVGRYLDLDSGDWRRNDILGNSSRNGRVVLISGEASGAA